MIYLYFTAFFAMQVTANLFFTYGSREPSRWMLCFVLGNIVGASSIWFLMMLYKSMQQNIAMAIALGGSFILIQAAIAVAFRGNLNLVQWCGILAIVVGIALTTLCATPAVSATRAVDHAAQAEHGGSLEEHR
jgi:multidrug transporter EmrE-like cation transporter